MPPDRSMRDRGGPAEPTSRFVTGDAVQLDVRFARLGSRMLARLVDIIVQLVLAYAVFNGLGIVLAFLSGIGLLTLDDDLFHVLLIVTVVLVFLGYPTVMETLTRGRTFGKLILGLRVVRDDGGPIAFRQAVTRGLVGAAVEWPGFVLPPLTWLASLWTMLTSPHGKRIGDYAAGTVVIHERTPSAWGWVPTMPPGLAGWAATLDLAGLDDDLALSVRHFLARNRSLREPARTQLGLALAKEVAAVTNPPPPMGTPGWAYLAAVHAERHRRAMRQLARVRARAATVWPELTAAVAPPAISPTARQLPRAGATPSPGSPLPPVSPTPDGPLPPVSPTPVSSTPRPGMIRPPGPGG